MADLNDLAFRWFRSRVDPPEGRPTWISRFNTDALRKDLLRANLLVTAQEYLATTILFTFLGTVLGAFAFVFFVWLSLRNHSPATAAVGLVVFLMLPTLSFYSYLKYPASLARQRERDIDYKLPYATNFIAAMASAKITPEVVFRGLARQPVYGEVQKEAARIMRDIDFLGLDLLTALRNAMHNSPSLKFQEFLQGTLTTITTGGHLKPYFVEKARELMRDNRADQSSFIEQLSLVSEAYITIVVAAPLFVLVMLSVLLLLNTGGSFARGATAFATLLVYVLVPLAQFGFATLIRRNSPEGIDMPDDINLRELVVEFSQTFAHPSTTLALTKRERDLRLRGICFWLTVITSFCLVMLWTLSLLDVVPGETIDYVVGLVMTLIGPAAFYEWRHLRRNQRIEATMGDFLRDLAESTRAGTTLAAAIRRAAEGEYSDLTSEIKTMAIQISWGITATEALEMFAERIRTPLVERSVALITEASHAGGKVADVLQTAAENSKEIQLLARERRAAMSIYTWVIYLSFIILAGVLMAIYVLFIPAVAEATETSLAASAEGQVQLLGEIDVDFFQTLFTSAIIIQGFGGGIVAGVISRARFTAGLQSSFSMVFIGYLLTKVVYWYIVI